MTVCQHQNNERLGGQHQSLSFYRFPQLSKPASRNEIFHAGNSSRLNFITFSRRVNEKNSRIKHLGTAITIGLATAILKWEMGRFLNESNTYVMRNYPRRCWSWNASLIPQAGGWTFDNGRWDRQLETAFLRHTLRFQIERLPFRLGWPCADEKRVRSPHPFRRRKFTGYYFWLFCKRLLTSAQFTTFHHSFR